jgi:glycosyltransferase involved in cell wall biosynthesis
VGTGREDFGGARAARRAPAGVVLQTVHQPWLLGSRKHRVPFFHALEAVDHVITVSQAQRRTYERIGVPPERMTTVPNGVRPRGPGPGPRAARAALGLDPEQPVVLTVGRLAVMKGQDALVAAAALLAPRFPDAAVVLLGSGHLHDSLRAQADGLGVGDGVHLPGHRADARALLDAADVFVLPSRHEGMPLALLEAMDAGLPVVATRVPGCTEVVVDGVTGLLVPPEDPPALAAAIARLLADPALGRRMARAGRLRYLESFTSASMAARTAAVYERELARAASTVPVRPATPSGATPRGAVR